MKTPKALIKLALLGIALGSTSLYAYEQGDIILRAGPALVDPDNGGSAVNIGGGATDFDVTVDDNTQLGITATYMLTDKLGIGLLAATPFKHDVRLNNAGALNGTIAETKHLPPTLTLQYYFNNPNSKFQPYAGVGINYTYFFDEETRSSALRDAANTRNVDLDDSFGLALEAGFDYAINSNWLINATVWYLDIETDATISSDLGTISSDVEIDPFVYMLGVGYKF